MEYALFMKIEMEIIGLMISNRSSYKDLHDGIFKGTNIDASQFRKFMNPQEHNETKDPKLD